MSPRLLQIHPAPWYYDECSNARVIVKDSRGVTVYLEDFGGIPDEMKGSAAEEIREATKLIAAHLIDTANQFA